MNLFITQEKFYIEPKIGKDLLIIDRVSEATVVEKKSNQIPADKSLVEFCGFLGSVQLLAGKYLVLATAREFIGFIDGHLIWKLAGTKLIPYAKSTIHINSEQLEDNAKYLSMIQNVLNTPSFYFSYSYDISHTMQRLHKLGPESGTQSLLSRADMRFVWNQHFLKGFANSDFKNFTLPIIHGFVSINRCVVNGHNFTWAIMSRRSVLRSGTRLFRRGIDRDGNVANFVETEQIVEYQDVNTSFVQIRGSIPLFWVQPPDLRYKPPPRLLDINKADHQMACTKHIEDVSSQYGRQVMIDLVDQKGAEGNLEKAFADTVNSIGNASVRYEPFDFHAECRKMRWDRLSILIDRVAHDQDEMGFFMALKKGALVSLQAGVFRTNCVDCLDRTNVVQSMLAKRALTAMLKLLDILTFEQTVEEQTVFEALFKGVWADNADFISIQYSGTGALKTDYTRTGKRTHMGLMRDGMNSLIRYYKNNFMDGFRQDSLDVFHGLADLRSPLRAERDWKYATFPSVLLVALAMFVTCAILPSEYTTEQLLFLLFWGSMVAATTATIYRYGPEFVDKPHLLNS